MLLLLLLPTLCIGHPRLATPLPDTAPSTLLFVSCSDLANQCLSQGKLLRDGNCYTPLERGPCLENEWFVMTNDAIGEGHCTLRPCVAGEVPFQTRCLTQAAAHTSLCQGGAVHLGPTGLPSCGAHPGWHALLAKYVRCSLQRLPPKPEATSSPLTLSTLVRPFKLPAINHQDRIVDLPGHKCGTNDKNECAAPVIGSSAAPELTPELR